MASAIYGNDFNSCFPLSSPGSPSASNLGLSMSIAPTLLKHDNIVSNSVNSGIVDGSKTKIFMDMISSPAIDRNSSRKVSSSDELVAATVSNSDHLEIQEDDTPAVIKIKGLSKKVVVLRQELETKSTLIESLKAQGKISGDGLASGSSWKDKVVPPGEAHSRMNLTFPLRWTESRLGFPLLSMLRLKAQRNGKTALWVILWIKNSHSCLYSPLLSGFGLNMVLRMFYQMKRVSSSSNLGLKGLIDKSL